MEIFKASPLVHAIVDGGGSHDGNEQNDDDGRTGSCWMESKYSEWLKTGSRSYVSATKIQRQTSRWRKRAGSLGRWLSTRNVLNVFLG